MKDRSISADQLAAVLSVIFLSPALRLVPSLSASLAGDAAWLCAPAAFLPAAAYLFLACRAVSLRREGEGLCELLLRALPGRAGRAAVGLLGLWLLAYSGFVLRSGADRFIVTVYPGAPVGFFVISMCAAALVAALSPPHCAGRIAKLVLPAAAGALIVVLGAGLSALRPAELCRLVPGDAPRLLAGSLGTLDVLSWSVYASFMLLGAVKDDGRALRRALLPRLGGACLLLGLMCAELLGSFGAELTASLSWPFFSLVRNLVFFRSVERIEALVVALWIFPDFLIVSVFLRAARRALSLALPGTARGRLARRSLLPLCAAATVVFALLTARDAASLELWSRRYIPCASMFVAFVFLPGVLAAGRARGRL